MTEKGKCSVRAVTICACEVAVLTSIILTIIGIFSIPTVLYALRSKSQSSESSGSISSECSDVVPYSGDLCRAELMSFQACFSGSASPLEVPSTIDQEMVEREILLLVQTLPVLEPSPECKERVKPFLCLQALGLCDSDGSHRTIPQKDCMELRDDICAKKWQVAVAFNVGGRILPVCEDLPDVSSVDECLGLQEIGDPQNNSLCEDGCQNQTKGPQTFCPQGFHVDESDPDFCRPLCGVREEVFTFKELAFILSFLSCIVLFILAATAQRELLKLPTVLLIYMNGTSFLLLSFVIIGLFDNAGFYCGSEDLFHSAERGNETGFCTFTGILLPYCLIQVSLWALLHSGFILLALASPFQYRELKLSGKLRNIHLTIVIVTLLIPLLPGLIILKDGYVITAFPVLACVGRNIEYVFYSLILPLSVALMITNTILVLICWRLLKEMLSSRKNYKLTKTKLLDLLKRAELKIVMILLYYTLTGTLALVTFELRGEREVRLDLIFRRLSDTNSTNATVLFPTLGSLGSVSDAAITTLACLPIVIFLFSFNFTACVSKLKIKERIRAAKILAKKNNNNNS